MKYRLRTWVEEQTNLVVSRYIFRLAGLDPLMWGTPEELRKAIANAPNKEVLPEPVQRLGVTGEAENKGESAEKKTVENKKVEAGSTEKKGKKKSGGK